MVDDELDARELVGCLLEMCGAEVYLADAPSSARELLTRQIPDVMISDIAMPGEDGYSLLRSVRANPKAHAVPAIALTAFTRGVDRERALGAGFDAHMGKPLRPALLLEAVLELAQQRSAAAHDGRGNRPSST